MEITRVGLESPEIVFDWVMRLLLELGEEGEELAEPDKEGILKAWRTVEDRYSVFLAKDVTGEIIGICTVMESFAIYANGNYGIIDEMYIDPKHRSKGVGGELISAVVKYGRQKGWRRIDVTAPENERWSRTRKFYEKEGFIFTGPKLKKML